MNSIEKLKEEYQHIPIPAELSMVVNRTISQHKRKKQRKIVIGFAIAASLFIASVNMSSQWAYALSDIPVIGKIVKLVTFREYQFNDETYNANLKVPALENLENKGLEQSLNEKYLKENEELYKSFMVDMKDLEKEGGGHLGVDSGYEVKTDNDRILSIARYTVNTVGSSSTEMKYDTIDKKKEILINLPSLFKNDQYIAIISKYIQNQMIEEMKADKDQFYWVNTGNSTEKEYFEPFTSIKKDQNFYITDKGKLVISFDKYEVAPGYMGVVDFEIPTKVIQKILVSNEYIQ